MLPERWEHGSDFHLSTVRGVPVWPWGKAPVTLAASGREALRQLVEQVKPRAVWLPDFYCRDVPEALQGFTVHTYPDDPAGATGPLPGEARDLVVRVNTWGLRADPHDPVREGVTLVEDHTHDPFSLWASRSRADFAFASLRKALPLADGAALWSPARHRLPPELLTSATHAEHARTRWHAMTLKAAWLDGGPGSKDEFRRLYVETESTFATDLRSGPSDATRERLVDLPTHEWTKARADNFVALAAALRVKPLAPALHATPFAATFVLPTPVARQALKQALVERRVYPAVLWPLPGVDLSERVLSVHCDGRYTAADMRRVADLINEVT